jgi:hypothetical protein
MRVLPALLVVFLVLVPVGSGASRTTIAPSTARKASASIEDAIAKERTAIAHVGTTGILPHVYLYQSIDSLNAAWQSIENADGAAPIVKDLQQAVTEDHVAISHQGDKSKAKTLDGIRSALVLKKKAITLLSPYTVASSACTAEKQFPLYAVPAGYSGSYTDVYPHGVPTDAQDIEVKFVDAATGAPAPANPFPGQTWTSKIEGFTTRAGETVLHVHIDISGTGVGKPDEKSVEWKVIVTWKC